MGLLAKLKQVLGSKAEPEHLRRGRLGEQAAKRYLQDRGMEFLTANYRSAHGEIDLVFRDRASQSGRKLLIGNTADCLVFAEVKTRSSEDWARPAAAVDARKRRALSLTAEDYRRQLRDPRVKWRFDVVEVLLADGEVREVRHVVNAFVGDTRRARRK